MKKLFSILMPLMTLGRAFAEETASATEEAITVVEEIVPVVEKSIHLGELLNKGLIVTAGGLAGVFLVLILFFLTIKGMQKILK